MRKAGRFGGVAFVGASLFTLTACTNANADPSKSLLPTPTVAAAPMDRPVAPELDSAVAVVLDVTSSTRPEYLTGTEALVADALDQWPQAGKGGIEVVVTLINSFSYNPVNEVLAGKVDGLPLVPSIRMAAARPAQPDLNPCKANAFTRVKCEEGLVHGYNLALAEALADERAAEDEYQGALATQAGLSRERATEMKALSDELRNLRLTTDTSASDISGGILRAAEFLNASKVPHKKLVQSDLDPYGPQQRGTLQLQGFDIVVVFWDCHESRSCAARKDETTQRFIAAGAASVVFYDPASSRLLTNILGGGK